MVADIRDIRVTGGLGLQVGIRSNGPVGAQFNGGCGRQVDQFARQGRIDGGGAVTAASLEAPIKAFYSMAK